MQLHQYSMDLTILWVLQLSPLSSEYVKLHLFLLPVHHGYKWFNTKHYTTVSESQCWYNVHILMLMDDTVTLATERTKCIQILNILWEFCKTSGMVINEGKTNSKLWMAQQAISNHWKHNQQFICKNGTLLVLYISS